MTRARTPELLVRDVGRRIRELRIRAGLKQREAAAKLGIAVRTYQRYESGQNHWLSTLERIADALGVPPGDLLDRPSRDRRRSARRPARGSRTRRRE